ncbi:MAG: ral secretion pathway protein [Bryobacterales bacterium]|nr:ral secretion pathway protein [Bryobacterales bacterium]
MTTTRRKSERGVTLIEMLVVITIIGLIAGLVSVNVIRQGESAKRTAARAQISSFMNALGIYKLDTGAYPPTSQGLQALRVKTGEMPNWAGPYLPKDVPLDPWGRPYEYKYPGDHGEDPDVISLGADGQPGGDGTNADIVSWSNK